MLVLLTALSLALPLAAADPVRAAEGRSAQPAVEVSGPAQVLISAVNPAVAGPKSKVVITGTVRNLDSTAVARPQIQIEVADRTLGSRAAVAAWANGTDTGVVGPTMDSVTLAHRLAPGAAASFRVVLHVAKLKSQQSVATLPVTVLLVDAGADDQPRGSARTFLPYFYPGGTSTVPSRPIQIGWLVPLTLPADPALFGYSSAARVRAWQSAIGPHSTISQLLDATKQQPVTYLLDPAAVSPAPPVTPASTTTAPTQRVSPSTSKPSGSSTTKATTKGKDAVSRLAAALATRLRASSPDEPIWTLPYADPDVSGLIDLPDDRGTLRAAVAVKAPASLGTHVRSGIAWPADGALNSTRIDALRARWAGAGPTAAITSADTLTAAPGQGSDAERRSTNGLPLLAYDDDLSALFAATDDQADGGDIVQRFLAETLGAYQQDPAGGQSMLVVPPRGFQTRPSVLHALFQGVLIAPWLSTVSAGALLAGSRKAAPEVAQAQAAPAAAGVPGDPTAYPVPDPTVLNQGRVDALHRQQRDIQGVASVLDRQSGSAFQSLWSDTDRQLASTRWRDGDNGWTAVRARATAAVRAISAGVTVSVPTINLFADNGVLQLTVVNNLGEAVHNLQLKLTPRRDGLKVSGATQPIEIGPRSRTTVKVRVSAVAAGLVPVDVQLRSAEGTPFGGTSTIQVHVRPTSTWIFWVLGGLAALILALGIYRTIRRPAGRAPVPEPTR